MSNDISAIVWPCNFGTTARKALASRLADHADANGCGIWPSVSRLARECNMSSRTVQRTLKDFQDENIIVQVRAGGKGKGNTSQYDFVVSTLVQMHQEAMEELAREQAKIADETNDQARENAKILGCHSVTLSRFKGDTVSSKGDTVSPKGDTVSPKPSITINNHHSLSGGASEGGADAPERERAESRQKVESSFKLAWQGYDNRLKSSYQKSLTEWRKLSPEDREIATRRIPAFKKGWINDGGTKSMMVAFSTYLSDRKFDEVVDPKPASEPVDDGKQALTKFGKAWCVVRLAWLRTGQKPVRDRFDLDGKPIKVPDYMRYREMYPKVHAMDNQPVQRLSPENAVKPEILAECVAVAQGSADWQAWMDYHAAMDWPMVEVGDWNKPVWFPARVPNEWAGYQEVAA